MPPESPASSAPPRSPSVPPPASQSPAAGAPSAAQIQACLDQHNGSIELAWRALGLGNRYALRRLIAKHGLEVRRRPRP
jgi:transcriptional regulator with GAF, ATPase, and Fis domain